MDKDSFLQEIFGSTGLKGALIGVFCILALFLLAETISIAENFGRPTNPATDTITVSGTGQATVAPDVANVSFTVQNTAPAVSDAQAATTKQANDALSFLTAQGIADKDVQTLSYDISPQYAAYPTPCAPDLPCPYDGTSGKVTGYQVSETIQVTVHDLSAVGTLLEGLGKLSVQNISGPDFALADPTAGYDAARAAAITNAKAQAMLLASQLNVSLGKIVNFSESSGGYPGPMMTMSANASADGAPATPPTIQPGQNTYNASVSITYEIR
jgi:uncharacterized protein YggE